MAIFNPTSGQIINNAIESIVQHPDGPEIGSGWREFTLGAAQDLIRTTVSQRLFEHNYGPSVELTDLISNLIIEILEDCEQQRDLRHSQSVEIAKEVLEAMRTIISHVEANDS